MKLKKALYIIVSFILVCSMCIGFVGCEKEPEGTDAPTDTPTETPTNAPTEKPTEDPNKIAAEELKKYDVTGYDINKYISPIWGGDVSYAEAAFVRQNKDGVVEPIQLLYPIDKIISVRSPDYKKIYKEGKDYKVTEDGKLEILEGSSIPALKYDKMYFSVTTDRDTWLNQNPGKGMWWWANHPNMAIIHNEVGTNGGIGMLGNTIAITYKHSAESVVSVPADMSIDYYSKLISKLENGENVTVVSMGDSITDGWSATGKSNINLAPNTPPYNEMVVDYMKEMYPNAKITHKNIAVSGSGVADGAKEEKLKPMCDANPDLVIIAFGMNDGGKKPGEFLSYINTILTRLENDCPNARAVVVGTCFPNPEMSWSNGGNAMIKGTNDDGSPNDNFPLAFADACVTASRKWHNAAFANVSLANKEMFTRKCYFDVAGSNSNHPNDYMHRVYAQVVVQTVFGTLD